MNTNIYSKCESYSRSEGNSMGSKEMVSIPKGLLLEAEASLRSTGLDVSLSADLRKVLEKPTEQHQGEPVAWFMPELMDDKTIIGSKVKAGAFTHPLYGRADPGEVERLHSKIETMRRKNNEYYEEVERLTRKCQNADLALKVQTQNCDSLRKENARLLINISEMNDEAKLREAQLVERDALLSERDALLSELAEAAEMFSCSAHCETSDAGDALELLNKILARVDAHKAPKCRVCGHKLHAAGYCSFRDCGVPGRGTRALSASAEPSAPTAQQSQALKDEKRLGIDRLPAAPSAPECKHPIKCARFDNGEIVYHVCQDCLQVFKTSAPVERDERAAFEATYQFMDVSRDLLSGCYYSAGVQWRWDGWQARAALERKP